MSNFEVVWEFCLTITLNMLLLTMIKGKIQALLRKRAEANKVCSGRHNKQSKLCHYNKGRIKCPFIDISAINVGRNLPDW